MPREQVFPEWLKNIFEEESRKTTFGQLGFRIDEHHTDYKLPSTLASFFHSYKHTLRVGRFSERTIGPFAVRNGIDESYRNGINYTIIFYCETLHRPPAKIRAKYLERLCSAIDSLDHRTRTIETVKETWHHETTSYYRKIEDLVSRAIRSNETWDTLSRLGGPLASGHFYSTGQVSVDENRYRHAMHALYQCLSKEHNRQFVDHMCQPYRHTPKLFLSSFNYVPVAIPPLLENEIAYLVCKGRGRHASNHTVHHNEFTNNFVANYKRMSDAGFDDSNRPRSWIDRASDQVTELANRVGNVLGGRNTPTTRRPRPSAPVQGENHHAARQRHHRDLRTLNEWKATQRQANREVSSDDELSETGPEDNDDDNIVGGDVPPPRSPPPPNNEEDDDEGEGDEEDVNHPDEDEEFLAPPGQPGILSANWNRLMQRATNDMDRIRARPNNFRDQSHRRRFNDATGRPQIIRRTQLRQNDIVVTYCNNIRSVRYLLTFGGEDKHFIFNPIEPTYYNRWS